MLKEFNDNPKQLETEREKVKNKYFEITRNKYLLNPRIF